MWESSNKIMFIFILGSDLFHMAVGQKFFSHPNASGGKPGYLRLITACRDGSAAYITY